MDSTKPMAVFSRASGGRNYHVRLLTDSGREIVYKALCGFIPKGQKQGRWANTLFFRPAATALCSTCALKAHLSGDVYTPSEAIVIYGDAVKEHVHAIQQHKG